MKKVTSDLIYILNKHKPLIPGLIYNDPITVALEQLTTLLNRNIKPEINSAHFQGWRVPTKTIKSKWYDDKYYSKW